MAHNTVPPRAESLEDLGRKLANLRYDALTVVLRAMARDLNEQKLRDQYAKHRKLGHLGHEIVGHLFVSAEVAAMMFHVSAPYMKEDLAEHPSVLEK